MFHHQRLENRTGLKVFFADPHSPWQRGSNENANGLLRQYYPKGTDLGGWSQDHLDGVAAELNDRPRECLNDLTPRQAMRRLGHRRPTHNSRRSEETARARVARRAPGIEDKLRVRATVLVLGVWVACERDGRAAGPRHRPAGPSAPSGRAQNRAHEGRATPSSPTPLLQRASLAGFSSVTSSPKHRFSFTSRHDRSRPLLPRPCQSPQANHPRGAARPSRSPYPSPRRSSPPFRRTSAAPLPAHY